MKTGKILKKADNYIFEKKQNKYWKTQKKINYSPKTNGNYYVIRRKDNVGLFSYYITTLGEIKFAISNGLVPVVDLMNYPNLYMPREDIGKYNPWELFFIQPSGIDLKTIQKTAKILTYSSNEIIKDRPNDNTDFLYSLNDSQNEWRQLVKQYIKINPFIVKELESEESRCFGANSNVLGVLCRGTDYTTLKPKEHPVQPDLLEIAYKINFIRETFGCRKILLVTEDRGNEAFFKNAYGEDLIIPRGSTIEYNGGYLGAEISKNDKNFRIQTGLDYLIRILLLSKCRYFIAGRTSGTVGVMLQEHNFEYTYFFDKGRYE